MADLLEVIDLLQREQLIRRRAGNIAEQFLRLARVALAREVRPDRADQAEMDGGVLVFCPAYLDEVELVVVRIDAKEQVALECDVGSRVERAHVIDAGLAAVFEWDRHGGEM